MKISIMCESMMIQEALSHYLKDSLCEFKDCEFVVSDVNLEISKPVCLISNSVVSDIKKPFTQVSLFQDIQNFYYSKIHSTKITSNPVDFNFLKDIKNPELKMQIDSILEEFSKKIYQTLKNDK